ncbi:AT-rich interactive domain protein [Arabidopsis thaliana]|uniref:AT-rich interactive domain protein n=1 Tax=Arabidopsis thaliana TaxID=3702 RepID=F4HS13_ARATH|nr:AT-rich interactive domain protein [Arabidopsis thaliana]AEE35521.1 AT-rich interactive domain protein [Arabidopsis thaliana]|eukprot:NP_683492.1 AT-rich interactive domain protein [Arabidopsis thaliana]
MALTVSSGGGGARIRCNDLTDSSRNPFSTFRLVNFPNPSRTEQQEEGNEGFDGENPPSQIVINDEDGDRTVVNTRFRGDPKDAPKFAIKDLPGLEPDPFEGEKWDGLGFFVQYLWAFGILFALISGGLAAGTYNEGATDFKETPVYKEAIQSRDLLDEAESSNSEDVFESNPTEVAPTIFQVDLELVVFIML